jgi:hypothetical protein
MNLSISVVWKGNGIIDIAVTIVNNEELSNNNTPNTPTLTGPRLGILNKKYNFTVSITDPDNEQVWYWIDWGDGTNTSWKGPFVSGTSITESHIWKTKEKFTIKAKARDIHNAESDWVTLSVIMPYSLNKPLPQFFERLFQRFPNAFPILRHQLGY